jgi:hypothetical protein
MYMCFVQIPLSRVESLRNGMLRLESIAEEQLGYGLGDPIELVTDEGSALATVEKVCLDIDLLLFWDVHNIDELMII